MSYFREQVTAILHAVAAVRWFWHGILTTETFLDLQIFQVGIYKDSHVSVLCSYIVAHEDNMLFITHAELLFGRAFSLCQPKYSQIYSSRAKYELEFLFGALTFIFAYLNLSLWSQGNHIKTSNPLFNS